MTKEAVGREREPGGGEATAAAAAVTGAGRRAAVRAPCPRRLVVCRRAPPRTRYSPLFIVGRALVQLFPVLHRDLPQCCSF